MSTQTSYQTDNIDLTSQENRKKLALLAVRLFEKWGLTTADQLELLGLSSTSRKMLGEYRKGKALPNSRDMRDRIGWLLAIHKALRILYPKNEEILYSWVKRRNRLLDNQSPIDIMKDQGIIGLAKISRYLDHQRGL